MGGTASKRKDMTISEKTPQAVAPPRRMCSVRAPSSPRNPAPAGQAIRSVPAYACSVVPEAVVTKECEPFVPEERPKQPFDNRDVDTGDIVPFEMENEPEKCEDVVRCKFEPTLQILQDVMCAYYPEESHETTHEDEFMNQEPPQPIDFPPPPPAHCAAVCPRFPDSPPRRAPVQRRCSSLPVGPPLVIDQGAIQKLVAERKNGPVLTDETF